MRIVDATGSVVANYSYDAWGKVTNSGNIVGLYNPIRYRGYYYDTDTGFYYLQSRYYDPTIKRFISADDASLLGANGDFTSLNLYAYCGNNPVARSDDGGTFWNVVIGAAIGGISSFVSNVATDLIFEGTVDWNKAFVSSCTGMIIGAVSAGCPALAPWISTALSAGESVFFDVTSETFRNGEMTIADIVVNATVSAGFGLITSTWENEFVNNSLLDDAVKNLPKSFFGNNTQSRNANKVIRKANRFILKQLGSSLIEDPAVSILSTVTQNSLRDVCKSAANVMVG